MMGPHPIKGLLRLQQAEDRSSRIDFADRVYERARMDRPDKGLREPWQEATIHNALITIIRHNGGTM